MSKKNNAMLLAWGAFILYAIMTFTKINFSAAIPYIVKEGIFNKTNSGIITGVFYFVYGMCQILLSKVFDRYSPAKIEIISLTGSILCNAALCFSTSFSWVLVFWSINGFFQCLGWPGAVKIVTEYIPDEKKHFASLLLTVSIAAGGILSYLVVAKILETFGWSSVFVMNAVIMIFTTVMWLILIKSCDFTARAVKKNVVAQVSKSDESLVPMIFSSGVALIFIVLVVRAVLDNGLKTWVPSMMLESYNLSTVWAGMQTAIIYICNIAGTFIIAPVLIKTKNEARTFAVVLAICLPFVVALLWIGKIPQIVAILSLIIITTLSFCLNNVQIMISSKFAHFGESHSGAVASLSNGFASFGVLIASVLFGYLAENFSWKAVLVCCILLIVLSVLLLIPAYFMWRRFLKNMK